MSSFGETLKRERELREITLREISEATKVNMRYLEALEQNDFRHLPGGVFNKGFVRAFAQFIGVDPEEMVNAYLQEVQEQDTREATREREARRRSSGTTGPPWKVRAEAREEEDRPAASPRGRLVVSMGALVLGALAIGVFAAVRLWVPDAAEPGQAILASIPRAPVTTPAPPGAGEVTSKTPVEPTDAAPVTTLDEPPVEEPVEPPKPKPVEKPVEEPVEEPAEQPKGDANDDAIEARLILARRTTGSVNCDGEDVKILDTLPRGAELTFRCAQFLTLHADDGGAIRLGLDGSSPTPLAPNGVPVEGYRILPTSRAVRANAGSPS